MSTHDNHVPFEDLTSKDYYFDAYADFRIHEDMLKDEIRTLAYQNAVYQNAHLFKDKIVLDVGSGTGILSMFAAKAGAKRVIGIEFSSMAQQSKLMVKDNNLDKIITIVQGKVEDIELPDGIEKVDVIISEWIGFCLFQESMLNTVLFARDKWLSKEGVLFPDKATLYVCGIEGRQRKKDKVDWWNNIYGFNMAQIRKSAISLAVVDDVDPLRVMTNSSVLKEVDLYTANVADLSFATPYSLTLKEDENIDALVTYFTIEFSKCQKPICLSTAPDQPSTHWKQTVFYLEEAVKAKRGEKITGIFTLEPNKQLFRDLAFNVSINFHGALCDFVRNQTFRMVMVGKLF